MNSDNYSYSFNMINAIEDVRKQYLISKKNSQYKGKTISPKLILMYTQELEHLEKIASKVALNFKGKDIIFKDIVSGILDLKKVICTNVDLSNVELTPKYLKMLEEKINMYNYIFEKFNSNEKSF